MPEKITKRPFHDEDFLFLVLELIDFPNGAKATFDFEEFKWLKYKTYRSIDLLATIVNLKNREGLLNLEEFHFDPFQLEKTFAKAKKILLAGVNTVRAFPNLAETISINKIMNNKFDFIDIQNIANSVIFDPEVFIRGINFKIKTNHEIKKEIEKNLRFLCELFCENKLEDVRNRYYTFENHKKFGFEIIRNITDEAGKITILKDSDFNEKFRFLEFMLSLHFEKYLQIEKISLNNNGIFIVKATIKEKLLNEQKNNHNKKTKSKEIKTLKLSPNTAWENMTIKFKNDFDLEIFAHEKYLGILTNEDLGFYKARSKDRMSDSQWDFFKKISTNKGIVDFSSCKNINEKDKLKKQKSKFSKNLKLAFNKKDDPFQQLPEKGKLKTRFELVPHPDLRQKFF